MVWSLWKKLLVVEEEIYYCPNLDLTRRYLGFYGVLWCIKSWFALCANVDWQGHILCLQIVEGSWEELSIPWLGIGCGSILYEDMVSLFCTTIMLIYLGNTRAYNICSPRRISILDREGGYNYSTCNIS